MSDPNILIGYIEEALPKYQPDSNFFRRANDAVIDAVPPDDAWPPLCRSLFSTTGADSLHGSFRGRRLIHFAGHFNHFGDDLSAWLDKFEPLLRRLYWMHVEIFLLHSWGKPPLCLRYSILPGAVDVYSSPEPRPPDAWNVSGHPVTLTTENEFAEAWVAGVVDERKRKSGGPAAG